MAQKQEILNYFSILKNRSLLGSSYLFVGDNFSIVGDIARLINCQNDFCGNCWDCKQIDKGTHPDLFVVEPEGLSIKIEAIREAIRFLSLKSFKLKNKVLIIKDAQCLGPAAANAFLKTLEEPPKNCFIAVCSSKLEGMPPTIISRCRKIFLPPKPGEIDPSMIDSVVGFLRGENLEFKDRKKFVTFLWTLIMFLHDSLVSKATGLNNKLPKVNDYEIILKPYSLSKMHNILKDILKIYSAGSSVNMNLALNLIRMKL